MASFPNAVKSFTTKNPGDTIQSAHIDDLQDEVAAIEDGYLNGTARLNSSNSTIANLSVSGGSTLAGSVTLNTIPYTFPASAPGSSGTLLTVQSTGTPNVLKWMAPAWTFLHAGNGSDSNASAANVDTVAISGLTANDTIRVIIELESVTQNTAQVTLFQATDSVTFAAVSPSPLTAGAFTQGEAIIRQRQGNTANVLGLFQGVTGTATRVDNFQNNNVTQAWTGSWTLALRHGGVTAGGQLKWAWVVVKEAGQ